MAKSHFKHSYHFLMELGVIHRKFRGFKANHILTNDWILKNEMSIYLLQSWITCHVVTIAPDNVYNLLTVAACQVAPDDKWRVLIHEISNHCWYHIKFGTNNSDSYDMGVEAFSRYKNVMKVIKTLLLLWFFVWVSVWLTVIFDSWLFVALGRLSSPVMNSYETKLLHKFLPIFYESPTTLVA